MFLNTGPADAATGTRCRSIGRDRARNRPHRRRPYRRPRRRACATPDQKPGRLLRLGLAVGSGRPEIAPPSSAAARTSPSRACFPYTRGQEQAADQYAVRLLKAIQTAARGPAGIHAGISSEQEVLLGASQDPYLRTHPLTRTGHRLHGERPAARGLPTRPAGGAGASARPLAAKLIGFLDDPSSVAGPNIRSDKAVPARYARSIAFFLLGEIEAGPAADRRLDRGKPGRSLFPRAEGPDAVRERTPGSAVPEYRRGAPFAAGPRR